VGRRPTDRLLTIGSSPLRRSAGEGVVSHGQFIDRPPSVLRPVYRRYDADGDHDACAAGDRVSGIVRGRDLSPLSDGGATREWK
jgi:hypothetical protein